MRIPGLLCTVHLAIALIATPPAWATNEPFVAEREAYTTNHQLLIKLVSVPSPIPMEKYFSLQLAVYDGSDPHRQLSDVRLEVAVGMSHAMSQGFVHGMQSSPQVEIRNGIATVSGMFFHMTGEWTLQVTVHAGGRDGTASFILPCCAQ